MSCFIADEPSTAVDASLRPGGEESLGCESDVVAKPLNKHWVKWKALQAGFRFESWSRVCLQSGIWAWWTWDMIQILLQTLWPEPILKYLLQIPAGQANSTTVHPQLPPIICGFQHVCIKNSGNSLRVLCWGQSFLWAALSSCAGVASVCGFADIGWNRHWGKRSECFEGV